MDEKNRFNHNKYMLEFYLKKFMLPKENYLKTIKYN